MRLLASYPLHLHKKSSCMEDVESPCLIVNAATSAHHFSDWGRSEDWRSEDDNEDDVSHRSACCTHLLTPYPPRFSENLSA